MPRSKLNKYGFDKTSNQLVTSAKKAVSKEPQLVKSDMDFISDVSLIGETKHSTDSYNFYSDIGYRKRSIFTSCYISDSFHPITLMPRAEFWVQPELDKMVTNMCKYMLDRKMEFYMLQEVGEKGNLHFHGIIGCYDMPLKNLQVYFNKKYGKFYKGQKVKSFDIDNQEYYSPKSIDGWYDYVHKDVQKGVNPSDIPYMF